MAASSTEPLAADPHNVAFPAGASSIAVPRRSDTQGSIAPASAQATVSVIAMDAMATAWLEKFSRRSVARRLASARARGSGLDISVLRFDGLEAVFACARG